VHNSLLLINKFFCLFQKKTCGGCGMTDMTLWNFIAKINVHSLMVPEYEEEQRLLLSYAHVCVVLRLDWIRYIINPSIKIKIKDILLILT
jgi:hypothetical protein